jgi:hypothetical protein
VVVEFIKQQLKETSLRLIIWDRGVSKDTQCLNQFTKEEGGEKSESFRVNT